jgi:hypothetical protein
MPFLHPVSAVVCYLLRQVSLSANLLGYIAAIFLPEPCISVGTDMET